MKWSSLLSIVFDLEPYKGLNVKWLIYFATEEQVKTQYKDRSGRHQESQNKKRSNKESEGEMMKIWSDEKGRQKDTKKWWGWNDKGRRRCGENAISLMDQAQIEIEEVWGTANHTRMYNDLSKL